MTNRLLEFETDVPDPDKRRITPGNVNGRLVEAVLRHRHYILRVENSVLVKLLQPFRDAQAEILSQLARLGAREGALTDFRLFQAARLREMEVRIQAALQFALGDMLRFSSEDFLAMATREIQIQNAFLRRYIPKGISLDLAGPDVLRLEAIVNQPLGGLAWGDRMRRNLQHLNFGMQRSLSLSVALGEGMGQAVTRLRKVAAELGTNRLATITRSEIQRIANHTAVDLYSRNSDVIKAIQVMETLDNRTCLICAAQDGKVFPVGTAAANLPPYHASCRGFAAPVVRSFEEMGLDPFDFPASTRASMNGQVADTIDYEQWFGVQSPSFQRQILGPSRFELFASGELKISEFTRDLRILGIDELPTMSLSVN